MQIPWHGQLTWQTCAGCVKFELEKPSGPPVKKVRVNTDCLWKQIDRPPRPIKLPFSSLARIAQVSPWLLELAACCSSSFRIFRCMTPGLPNLACCCGQHGQIMPTSSITSLTALTLSLLNLLLCRQQRFLWSRTHCNPPIQTTTKDYSSILKTESLMPWSSHMPLWR